MIPLRACVLFALLVPASMPAQQFRVVTSNLWHSGTEGVDYVNYVYPLGHAVTWPGIKAYMSGHFNWRSGFGSYGIVGLQEVDHKTVRTGQLDVGLDLAKHLGPGWTHRFHATQPFQGGQAGNAVLTNAGVAKLQYWNFAHDPNNPQDYGKHPRGAIAAKLDFAGKRLWFVNTHLETKNSFALAQVFQLLGKIKTFDPDVPVIVVGDMNILHGTGLSATEKTYMKMAAAFAAADFEDISYKLATRVQDLKNFVTVVDGQLDYIFVYNPHELLRVQRCRADWVMVWPHVLSDHRALVADFEWN